MSNLKLGPLPKVETVRVTVTMPKLLKDALDFYAEVHGKLYGPVDAVALIPHMLEAFIRSDRAFMQRQSNAARVREPPSPAPLPNGIRPVATSRDSPS